MKHFAITLMVIITCPVAWAESYYHDYKSFFGKEDRVGMFSEEAKTRYLEPIRQSIIDNTLLIDCGSKGKPATGFVVNFDEGQRVVTAAHNVQMAKDKSRPCYVKGLDKTEVIINDFKLAKNFRNSATLLDAGFDVATSDTKTSSYGFNICKSIDVTTELVVPQSYDGKGYLTLSPACQATNITKHVITTTCRGHYKASGAPLLAIKNQDICAAGVFNALSGKLMNYESYAARLVRD